MKRLLKKLPVTIKRKCKTHPLSADEFLLEFTHFEQEARREGYLFPAGIDEAGRGPLAGPVVASACILPPNFHLPGLNDSKKLTAAQRRRFFDILTQDPDVHFAVGIVCHQTIDSINILEATKLAMCQAVRALPQPADFLLIDAVELKNQPLPYLSLIKGDCRSQAIAAASVIAKETRDRLMMEYEQEWPQYGFGKHKGYGTKAHREAIAHYGPCPIHRRTFEPIKSYVEFLS